MDGSWLCRFLNNNIIITITFTKPNIDMAEMENDASVDRELDHLPRMIKEECIKI